MTTGKHLLCLIAATLCVASSGQEPLARLDVNSVMNFTMRAGRFADRIKPGSSGMMALGMVGLTVNPQFCNYDLSRPFSILVYSDPNGFVKSWSFCGVLWRRCDKSPIYMKIGGNDFVVRAFGGRAAIASSEPFLKNLPEDLTKDPSGDPSPETPDISLWLDSKKTLEKFPLADRFAPVPGPDVPPEKVEAKNAARVRWQALESLLRQSSGAKLSITVSEATVATIQLDVKAQPDTPLELFINSQRTEGPLPDVVAVEGATVFGSANLKPTAEMLSSLASAYGNLSGALGQSEKSAAYTKFATELASVSTGAIGFCVGKRNGLAFGLASIKLSGADVKPLADSLKSIGKMTGTINLYMLREWKSGVTSYCLLEGGYAWLLCGRLDEDDAADILAAKRHIPAGKAGDGLLMRAFTNDEDKGAVSIKAGNGSLSIKIEVTPATLDVLPLPPLPEKVKH